MGPDGHPLSRAVPKYNVAPLRSNADPIREHVVDTDNGFHIVRTQDCDDTIAAVHTYSTTSSKRSRKDGARYMGSAPLIVCEIWAKECGAPVGTREFSEYAHKKLTHGEYAKLKVHMA